MVELKNLISCLREMLLAATALVGLTVSITPYFQRPEVVYSTNELTAYPITYQDNRLVPAEIQGRLLVSGPFEVLDLVVQNKGERAASDVVVRIPLSPADDYIGGWMTKSEAPSTVSVLGATTEYTFPKLMPGDSISFCLYLRNNKSDLAGRIRVFIGDGRQAAYYRFVSARYLGSDGVFIQRRWIYLFGVLMLAILLLSVLRIWELQRPAISAERGNPPDTSEHLPASVPGSVAREQTSRDPSSSRRKAGGR